jgi:2-oxoisovalerate dehydrogenase E1 component
MQFHLGNTSKEQAVNIYKHLLLPRMIEEKMLILLRQGRISKWFSGIGQEAIAVGATMALDSDEWIMPLHRNLGVFTSRDMPLAKLFKQWQGSKDGYSKGRERSFHFGTKEHHICGMISHLGPQMAIADGIALAHKLRKENKISISFCGDGGTSEGDFHEALNVAAVWGLPTIFIIENNGYGLSTPSSEQFICKQLADRAAGYGMRAEIIDGNNILEVYNKITELRAWCIAEQKPVFLECMTFRMRGHEEASGTKYVPQHLFDTWAKKDPLNNYEAFLLEQKLITTTEIETIKATYKTYIEDSIQEGFAGPAMTVNTEEELVDVFAPHQSITSAANGELREIKMIQAITEALDESMSKHAELILMGQDIAEYGGAFKVTEGFVEKFGKARVRNTPLCESAIVGSALGLSISGMKAMMEMQFADFATVGFNQIVNNLAKIHYRWGQNADVVVRMPTGGGVGAGPFHSQSNEAWFTKVAGLKVVYPSNAYDAKGLLCSAFDDPNPVMFFEHKALYRSNSMQVPAGHYTIEIGKANVLQSGSDLSIITYGMGVHWATKFAADNTQYSIEILDLRSLAPLDYEAIADTVKNTGKVLLLHEDTMIGGLGGEISAWIGEHCFKYLDAPVMRCASLDTPVPFDVTLEKNFLANARLADVVAQLMAF